MWWFSPPPSQAAEQDEDISQELLNTGGSKGRGEPVGNGAWRLNRLTPVVSSPICAPLNKSGSKSRNVIRQSQPAGSVHSLASPICLLSSSPVVPAKGRRQTPKQTKPSADPWHVARTALSKPHAHASKASKSTTAATSIGFAGNMLIRNRTFKIRDHETENIFSPSVPPPLPSFVLNTSANASAKGKRLADELPSLTPDNSKKQRRGSSTLHLQPGVTSQYQVNDGGISSSAVSSKEAINSPFPAEEESFIHTERGKLALQRMDIAQQLANAYPHLVAPSYEQKRVKQLAKLTGKGPGRAAAHAINRSETINTANQKLVRSRTILSFETVDDDDGGMDWNRSRQLADEVREAIATGRKPVLPLLKCAQSPSPSP